MKKMHLTKKKVSEKTMRFIFYFILVCVSFVFLEPIFRIISKTFMTSEDIIDPMVDWVPRSLSLKTSFFSRLLTTITPSTRGTSTTI